jgi:hypothetical protein
MKLLWVGLLAASLGAQTEITGGRIREHVKFLASDLLEGRGRRERRGGELATAYLASQMALAGLERQENNGTFFQRVDLVGVEPQPTAKLALGTMPLTWGVDFVGNTLQQKSLAEFGAEAVFVGHGITAPEFGWDDYAGTDVKGKVVVLFTNEPPSDDPKFFGGKALTYYGAVDLQVRGGGAAGRGGLCDSAYDADGQVTAGRWCGVRGARKTRR